MVLSQHDNVVLPQVLLEGVEIHVAKQRRNGGVGKVTQPFLSLPPMQYSTGIALRNVLNGAVSSSGNIIIQWLSC